MPPELQDRSPNRLGSAARAKTSIKETNHSKTQGLCVNRRNNLGTYAQKVSYQSLIK